MPTTSRGYVYPASTDHTRLWEHLQNLANSVNTDVTNLLGAWTAYVPVLGGTSWAIGNGSTLGRYKLLGKTCFFRAQVTIGSTTTKGTGGTQATVSLPVAAHASMEQQCSGSYLDVSGPARGSVIGLILAGNNFASMYAGGAIGTGLVAAQPITWATGDTFTIHGTYETA